MDDLAAGLRCAGMPLAQYAGRFVAASIDGALLVQLNGAGVAVMLRDLTVAPADRNVLRGWLSSLGAGRSAPRDSLRDGEVTGGGREERGVRKRRAGLDAAVFHRSSRSDDASYQFADSLATLDPPGPDDLWAARSVQEGTVMTGHASRALSDHLLPHHGLVNHPGSESRRPLLPAHPPLHPPTQFGAENAGPLFGDVRMMGVPAPGHSVQHSHAEQVPQFNGTVSAAGRSAPEAESCFENRCFHQIPPPAAAAVVLRLTYDKTENAFDMWLDTTGSAPRRVLTARKKKKSKSANVSISTGRDWLSHRRAAQEFIGKLRKDPAGRKASVYDRGNNPDRPSAALPGVGFRRELLAIMQSHADSSVARMVTVLVPDEDDVPVPAPKRIREAGEGEGRLIDLLKEVGRGRLRSTTLLQTRPPPGDPRFLALFEFTGVHSDVLNDKDLKLIVKENKIAAHKQHYRSWLRWGFGLLRLRCCLMAQSVSSSSFLRPPSSVLLLRD